MTSIESLNPTRFFHYFQEICKIPHGSGNIGEISAYLVSFAKEHELSYVQDDMGNVIIKKPAAPGYENAPVVIIQGHMDMVCAKTADSTHDFTKDPLTLCVDGDWLTAKDTTLGADDGVSIAYALAILESDSIAHPALEVVITVDEEIGLLGAGGLDMSLLDGRVMINIDSEEDDCLLVGCAGGMQAESNIPVQYAEMQGYGCKVVIDGLKGGHSGADIGKMRANAALCMGRFLYELRSEVEYGLCEFTSGEADNAIPCRAEAYILINGADKEHLEKKGEAFQNTLQKIYRETDGGVRLSIIPESEKVMPALHQSSFTKVLYYLMQVPNGIQKMSGDVEGLPETSLNPGIVCLHTDRFEVHCCIRSSFETEKYAVADKIVFLTEFLGGECILSGEYPGWEYVKESKLRQIVTESYQKLFGESMRVELIHAGLECGLFANGLEGLDCVSIGPTMVGIHTVDEKLSISSVEKLWTLLLDVLKNMA